MKYEINQIVYFIGSLRGEIVITPLWIDKIHMDRRLCIIYYSGNCPEDDESIPHTAWEDELFSSRFEAVVEVQRQIDIMFESIREEVAA